jgi:HD-GYP domain-containing protein (c-di-GMP phosphodiesterase class II)
MYIAQQNYLTLARLQSSPSLNEQLQSLHRRICELIPDVDRIACVLYDPKDDLLKTFIGSNLSGEEITHYEFKLADSPSLSHLAKSQHLRILDDLPFILTTNTPHSAWLLKEGYQSSLTAPMYDQESLLGFIFFDSRQPGFFTTNIQNNLRLFAQLINTTIAHELTTVRAMLASVKMAKNFADLRDFETGAHLERIASYSRLIAKALAPTHGLTDEFIEHVFLFAALHDIGKVGIPDQILLKPGKLNPEERRVMETHVSKGLEIVDKILGNFGLALLPNALIMRNIVAYHHERMDGSGYPYGLKGHEIPIEARIVAVADVFDALTTQRPYKPSWTLAAAWAELEQMAARQQLDPAGVTAMKASTEEVARIYQQYSETQMGQALVYR